MKKIIAIKILNDVLSELEMKVSDLATALDMKRSQGLYDVLNPEKKVGISKNLADKICGKYPQFNKAWLLTGEGDMLKTGNKTGSMQNNNNVKGVPYFEDIESTGGIMEMYNDYKETPAFYINYEHFNDCTAYLLHVGDSMYPKYCSGEILAFKQITNFNVVLWGEAYLVVTNDNANNLRTVKLIFQHDNPEKIILRASNPNFKGDTVINKSDIVSMFIVKGKITRSQL